MFSFFFKRPDGSKRTLDGYAPTPPPKNAPRYASTRLGSSKLPPKVDLRPHMTPIENQGALNSCTANAVAGAYEYLVNRHQNISYDVSRLFIYYNARHMDGVEHEDQGSAISTAIDSLREYGACSEDTWPYQERLVNAEPDDQAYSEASDFPVEDVRNVPVDLNTWKQCLAEGHPIIFGLLLFSSFDSHRRPGHVPTPTSSETSRESHGGHAMLCVGYSDNDQVFIVRNSWGSSWGDNGYCYIPYRYLMNPKYNFGDSWIIQRLQPLDLPEDTWDFDEDASFFTDVSTELEAMDDETFSSMLDTFHPVPLEHRLAVLFLHTAAFDGELSPEEFDACSAQLHTILQTIGSPYDAHDVLQDSLHAFEHDISASEDVVQHTVETLPHFFSQSTLSLIISTLEEIALSDDDAQDEIDFIDHLVQEWNIDDLFETPEPLDEDEYFDDEDYIDEDPYEDEDEYDEDDEYFDDEY